MIGIVLKKNWRLESTGEHTWAHTSPHRSTHVVLEAQLTYNGHKGGWAISVRMKLGVASAADSEVRPGCL